ncbi:MAG: DUF5717 family protein [Acetatifactor sp.]
MQKIINQILEGNFDYENGSLDFSCAKIELSLHKGEQYEGSFHILAPQGQFTSGRVTSSDLRMECLTDDFVGCNEEIFFCFHGENLEEGDVVKGNFYVVSNQGEYYLPFVVSIEHTVLESSIGTIKNLFHFANLAKSNWQEAVRLFYSPEFYLVFQGSDAKFLDDYRALSAVDGLEQNVEEFLIQINKKQKVEFLVEEKELVLEALTAEASYAVTERELSIVRNGWGYTRLYVECSGDFLFTEKEVLTDDDFLGNHCRLPVFVDSSFCRKGKNFGQIFLYNSYVSLTIPVTVKTGEGSARNSADLTRKRSIVQLMEFYQAFRTRKIGTSTWLKETGKLVEKQVSMDENDITARLFQAQLLITEERYNEAGWILDHVSELLEKGKGNDTLLAYYLYLTTLTHRDEQYVNRVTADVERIYRQDNSNWRVAWLLLYLSEEYHKSVTGKWVFLEKQYAIGCSSPVLYIEALALLNNNPALLRRLGSFERQVLWYGVKQDILKQEVVEQLLYLTARMREYSQTVYRILEQLYKKKEDVRILQEICTLLIKGGKTGEKYLEWYQAGVENQLRITNLYEYYMMSLDMNRTQEIPKIVLMYFSYQNNLDYEHCAYLYDYILKNEDKFKDIFESYRSRMEHFCVDQILKLHINRHLANMYNRLLQPGMINEQTAEALSRLLFANMIRVEDDRLRKVYVYQPGNLYPEEYVLNGGETWVALYGNDCTIVFEDDWNNRFIRNVEYTIEKLMVPGKFLRMILPLAKTCPALDLYLCDSERGNLENAEDNIERALRVMDSGYCDGRVRRELVLRILQHYYDTDNMRCLDEYLQNIPAEDLGMEERGTVIRFMVLRGNYDLADEWLRTYGPYFIDIKILVRLISTLMEKNNMVEDRVLTASAAYVFQKGKYDSTVLRYLAMYYRGMTKSMRDIWKAAKAFDVDCFYLCEAILVQMLYSGAFVGEKMEIFHYYISQGAKPEVEEAFLAQCAYDYFVKERVMESDVFREIQSMYMRGEPVQKVCRLAYLKYYAEAKEERTEQVNRLTDIFLCELLSEGVHLEFFREYRDNPRVAQELLDKTIIEYHANPRGRACIHYVILRENGESDEYTSEYMQEAYGGVCFKEFILFFGESLQYYITEEKNGEAQLTESGTLQKSDISGEECDSRYQLVNDIVISKTLEDFDTMDNLLEEYRKKEFLNGKLFQLK